MEKKHLNVVCAVIHDGDKILCTQRLRKGPNYIAEHWEFPGGKVNEGESDHEALRREILEEMDWNIYVGAKLGSVEYDYPDFQSALLPMTVWHMTMILSFSNILIPAG